MTLRLYAVALSAKARADLLALHAYISERTGTATADRFTSRLEAACKALQTAPHRGTKRDDVRPGARTVGYRRRVTILFGVDDEAVEVEIFRLLYRGRDIATAMEED